MTEKALLYFKVPEEVYMLKIYLTGSTSSKWRLEVQSKNSSFPQPLFPSVYIYTLFFHPII